MISRVDLRGKRAGADTYRDVLPRAALDVGSALDVVRPICDDVRARGADAVREATSRLDGVDVSATPVPAAALARALADLDPAVRAALEEAIRRARLVHEAQRRSDATVEVVPGGTVTERWLPVRRVGLYVPGGLLAYPSSVVMNVVPAQVAGVRSLAVASPPQAEYGGLPHPSVLAACALLGIDEVHAVGGAQAVAMFAYGTADCERVDLVTGPGNVYVAAAKRLLRGRRRDRRRGRPDRDRDPRRRQRRPACRRRGPHRAGRARPERIVPARQPQHRAARRRRPRAGHPGG